MEDKELFDAMLSVIRVCDSASTSMDEQLMVLEFAWLAKSQAALDHAMAVPGEFPAERARQLQHLERITELVRGSEPDLERERFLQEGDIEALLRDTRKLNDDHEGS